MTLGGIAVIAHGLSRNTYDTDIWVEPKRNPGEWSRIVWPLTHREKGFGPVEVGTWRTIEEGQFEKVINRDGVVRINGLDRPLDIFRDPNELLIEDFDEVWNRAIPLDDGTRLPDVIDLLVTKQDTGREKDTQDIAFLEAKAEREYFEKLPGASADEAVKMLERFLTPRVAELALHHSEETVRPIALQFLRELAEAGNPYARDILLSRKTE
jgi:hypothetical protein